MKKKLLSILTAVVMMLGIGTVLPEKYISEVTQPIVAEAAASDHTADDAINWVKSKVGSKLGNGQCVDLINMYMDYLGVDYTKYLVKVAADFTQKRFCPEGWTPIQGAVPQKGDVLVYTGGMKWNDIDCGHVAIYENESSFYEQHIMVYNPATGNYDLETFDVKHSTYNATQTKAVNYWGVLRPDFKSSEWYADYSKVDLGKEFYAKLINSSSELCLSYEKSNAVFRKSDESEQQIWHFVRQSDGGYSILNKENGLSLDIAYYGTEKGTNVQLIDFTGNTAQHFYIYHKNGGFLLRPACSNLVFDLEGYDSHSSTISESYNLSTYPLDDYLDNKAFSIVKWYPEYPLANFGDSFDARIKNPSSKYYLTADKTNVVAKKEISDDTQIWHFMRNIDGSYSITNKANDYSMDILDYGTTNGTNVQLVQFSNNNAQRFFIYKVNGAYLFRPACSDLVLDVEGYDSNKTFLDNSYNIATYLLDDYLDNKLYEICKTNLGDCNNDGKVNISDAVLLQKYILNAETEIPNWKAADLCEDDVINTFDLAVMKQMLIKK